MSANSPFSHKTVAQLAGADRILLDFLKPFPNLFDGEPGDVSATLDCMAKRLSGTKRAGVIQFRLARGRRTHCRSLALSPEGVRVIDGELEKPTLEIIVSEKTWTEIASGQLTPLEAFGAGKLRVRGDIDLARSVVRRVCGR